MGGRARELLQGVLGCVFRSGWLHSFRSHSNSNMLIHPAQREAVLEPGGYTAALIASSH